MKTSLPVRLLVSLVFTLVVSAVCNAQSTRTFVSGIGNDTLPCSRVLPCRTFAGALIKTLPGGEIDALDSAEYGPVTITQSITVVGNGVAAAISAPGVDAITVSTISTDVVILKGLTLEGAGVGLSGINFSGSGVLQVENCTINNFTVNGIDFSPIISSAVLMVKDTTIRNNAGTSVGGMGGVYLHPVIVGARATFTGVHFDHNKMGLRGDDNSFVTMKDCDVLASNMVGVVAMSTSLAVTIDMEGGLVSQGTSDGIISKGPYSTITMSNVAVNKNSGFGIRMSNSGTIISFGNNRIVGNSFDGNPSYTVSEK